MDINKVVFGNFSLGAKNARPQKNEEKEAPVEEKSTSESKTLDATQVLSALDAAGMQNKLKIAGPERKNVNPLEYLSEDRISDIEAMMGKFENGVNNIADVIENEFPGFFSTDAKNALAAKLYAQE
jgi:hypothetical protein